jgi:hypothetical protein
MDFANIQSIPELTYNPFCGIQFGNDFRRFRGVRPKWPSGDLESLGDSG